MAGSIINLNYTNPAAPALSLNVTWQKGSASTGTDPATGFPIFPVSASIPYMVGDTGAGGTAGLVPPAPAGSAVLGQFLRADGSWASAVPTPSFVQGTSASSSTPSIAPALSGIIRGHTLLLHIRSGNNTAPTIASSAGNSYSLVHSTGSSFWGVYTYTYICFVAAAGTDTVTATFGSSSSMLAILAEYTAASGYESDADNGISANAGTISTLAITSTRPYECGIWFFSCGGFFGLSFNQTIRQQGSSGAITLMDRASITSGALSGTVTSGAMNQASITGLYLTVLGSVSSVALAAPAIFSVSGSPITTAGVLTLTLATQTANRVWAGPATGSPAAPTFRALVAADLPGGTGSVTSIAFTAPAEFSVGGSPITSSGTIALTKANQAANLVWAGPTTGSPAAPAFRALVAADLPLATSGAFGAVKPDGTTISISGGVITAATASPLTTKGDLYGFSTVNARFAVGSDTQVLTADSTQALGLKWAYPPLVVQFAISSGVTGTNVGPMLPAPRVGSLTKCIVCTKGSDGTIALSFRILKNGVNVFSSNPSVAAGTISGNVTTTGTLTSSPFSVAANDVFSIDILTGNENWQFTAQLE